MLFRSRVSVVLRISNDAAAQHLSASAMRQTSFNFANTIDTISHLFCEEVLWTVNLLDQLQLFGKKNERKQADHMG